MIEITVPLILPLRGVVLAKDGSSPPDWLQEQFSRLPRNAADRKQTSLLAERATQQQQELDQLRQQRDAWKQGLAELNHVISLSDAQCAAMVNELREAAVELAHAIASKLVFQQLAAGTFPVDRLVAEVLSRLNTREPVTVRLHPDDLAALQREEAVTQSTDSETTVKLVADARLSRGDCKAVAGEITVVYELHRQIEEIRRELLSTVNGHAEPRP